MLTPVSGKTWLDVLPQTIKEKQFRISIETPATVRELYKEQGRFCTDSHVSTELEMLIMGAFVDDLYDGAMHCLTLRDDGSGVSVPQASVIVEDGIEERPLRRVTEGDGTGRASQAVGIIFWRDLGSPEMKQWMKTDTPKQLADYAIQSAAAIEAVEEDASRIKIEHESGKTEEPSGDQSTRSSPASSAPIPSSAPAVSAPAPSSHSIYDSWMKVELVATQQRYFGQRIGTLLLAAALMWAMQRAKQHAVLHIAGGDQNVPATRLYQRFGFVRILQDAFNQPNKNIWVLPDIGRSLKSQSWIELLGVGGPRPRRRPEIEHTDDAKAVAAIEPRSSDASTDAHSKQKTSSPKPTTQTKGAVQVKGKKPKKRR